MHIQRRIQQFNVLEAHSQKLPIYRETESL